MTKTALILGASGSFGSNAATAFTQAGWIARRFDRARDDIHAAAAGADIIVNAMNPPNYRNWQTEVPRITELAISAARSSGATILVPGNVYNFGTQPGPWSAETPQRAISKKGQIRAAMETRYRQAAAEGIRTIILRGGDFINTRARGNFFDLVLTKGIGKGTMTYPGRTDIPHAWAYLPDIARAAVALAERRDDLPAFADISFEGFTLTGTELRTAFARILGREVALKQMQWWPIRLASPFWRLGRELLEMRYLWDHPHGLDGSEFARICPDYRATELHAALASALPGDVHPDETMVAAGRLAGADQGKIPVTAGRPENARPHHRQIA